MELAWENIDLQEGSLRIPDPKNREDLDLPLSDFLFEMFKHRASLRFKYKEGDEEYNKFVFECPRGRLHDIRYGVKFVRRKSDVHFTVHDLRRTFATVADALDIQIHTVKTLMNHKQRADVTAGYIVTSVDRIRNPTQRVTDYILREGGIPSWEYWIGNE